MILVMDFDGVIADGLSECLLVSWNTHHQLSTRDFNNNTLNAIPQTFTDKFRFLRNFVRHDGHFLVPFLARSELIETNQQFDDFYMGIPLAMREQFQQQFVTYRANAREQFFQYWLSLHTVYEPLIELIRSIDTRIVSGKDADSIIALLMSRGGFIEQNDVYGRVSDKPSVLKHLQQEALSQQQSLLFCDDNIDNVIGVQTVGIRSLWIGWGYHTPEHLYRAEKLDLPLLGMNDFINLIKTEDRLAFN